VRVGATLLLRRGLVYGLLGLVSELAWTGLRGRPRTSLWVLPVYGLAAPLFEPVHDRLRRRPAVLRGAAYSLGFSAVEYTSGRVFRRFRGEAPWDYSHARVQVHGLVRADYVPLWGAYGLALERVHDALESGGARRP
jgi:hypothetical protein